MAIVVTQLFRRTIAQPADGTDFFVTLPVPEVDRLYSVFAEQVAGDPILPPPLLADEVLTDRTRIHFRVISAGLYPDGAVLEFAIVRSE